MAGNSTNAVITKARDILKLGAVSRTDTALGSSKTTKFPNNLTTSRYIQIQIYDTSKDDPNKELLNVLPTSPDILKTSFAAAALSEVDTSGVTSLISSITDKGVETYKTIKSSLASAGSALSNTYEKFQKDQNDFGNPEIAGDGAFMDNLWLPLPNELTESLSHTYNEQNGFLQSIPIVSEGVNKSALALSGISNILSKATGTQALVANANKLQMFKNSEFRSITFNWTLIPNNQEESINIHKIITKLKAYSSPQAVNGKLMLRSPFYAKLTFANETLNSALNFKEVVMTNIEVNYSVTGYMETFKADETPKTMSLSITFKDREPKTLQDWANGPEGYSSESAGDTAQGAVENTTPTTPNNSTNAAAELNEAT